MFSAVTSWPGWGRTWWMRGSNSLLEPMSTSRVMAQAMSAILDRRTASCTTRAPMAVITWVPLIRASPSPAARASGAEPDAVQRLGTGNAVSPIKGLAFTDEHQAQVGRGRQVTAGTDRAFLRHHRCHPVIEKSEQVSNGLHPAAGIPQAQVVNPKGHDGPTTASGSGSPTPAA
jgi:hypothetical protein